VIVAPGADARAVAVAAQVWRHGVVSGAGEGRAEGRERPGVVEEAVEAEDRRPPAAVPLQEVVAEVVGDDLAVRRVRVEHAGPEP
jgi:hypothetical protein